jgi:hypothetical protein
MISWHLHHHGGELQPINMDWKGSCAHNVGQHFPSVVKLMFDHIYKTQW